MIKIVALYKFFPFPNFIDHQPQILQQAKDHNILGTLLLAHEGINGTICGKNNNINTFINWLVEYLNIGDIDMKWSKNENAPFHRMKVKLKKEIVTLGQEGIDPTCHVGDYVDAKDWNDLISSTNTITIDTRNDYEVAVGTFKNAIDPNTTNFRELPTWLESQDIPKDKNIAMFCTGGIRCEKSTSYLKSKGYNNVFHLKGGILKYLEDIPVEKSMWHGECFVFDNRVTVGHDLQQGNYVQCHGCRMPLSSLDVKHEHYIKGVQCHHCADKRTKQQKQGAAERHKQVLLAQNKGVRHGAIG